MFDCSHEALQRAIASVKNKYPASCIDESLALTLLTLISRRYENKVEFSDALQQSLTECHLWDDKREWYKTLAGSLFGRRGGEARHKKPQRKQKEGGTKMKKKSPYLYVFEEGNPQGMFFFFNA